MIRSRLASVLMSAVLFLIFPGISNSAVNSYMETFTTTQYRDTPNTTALWDTTAGELRLTPFVPSLTGAYDTPGDARAAHLAGDRLFVADGGSGLVVLDITDPAAPALIGTYDSPGFAGGLDVAGDHLYLADGASGLLVLDISNPAAPALAGTYDTPGYARGVRVAGERAYVADGGSGLVVLDVSNPAGPTLAGSYDTPGDARGVYVDGDHAYVADNTSGLVVLDITNPAAPALAGAYSTPPISCQGVWVWGDQAYVANGTVGLAVFDVSNPAAPALIGSIDTPGFASGVHVLGDKAYVGDAASGLAVFDVSDPAAPALAGTYDTPGTANGVIAAGTQAFVADGASGLTVIEVGRVLSPRRMGQSVSQALIAEVAVSGMHAYAISSPDGDFLVIDVSDPAAPTQIDWFPGSPAPFSGIDVSGNHAYLTRSYNFSQFYFEVLDISDPANPVSISPLVPIVGAGDVRVSGELAYVAAGISGLTVIDISNPASPTVLSTVATGGSSRGIDVAGDHAFLPSGQSGVIVVDISDPAVPTVAGSYDTPGVALDVRVVGDHVYVADQDSGLVVLDISDPATPTLVGSYDTGYALEVDVTGDLAYVADAASGLVVLDISDPAVPSLLDIGDPTRYLLAVCVAGDHAYLGSGASGSFGNSLVVYQVRQSEFDTDSRIGRSLGVHAAGDSLRRVRLSTTQTDTVTWELSADGGTSWQEVTPGGGWTAPAVSGADLRWRSTHSWSAPGVNPAVSLLQIDWLYDFPMIEAVTDIPNDQGRQVRLQWTRSGRDFIGDPSQIVEYAVYRKIDPGLGGAASGPLPATAALASSFAGTMPASPVPGPHGVIGLSPVGRQHALQMAAAGWDFLVTVPVRVEDAYAVVVPTLADSTVDQGQYRTTFRVSALTATPGVFYDSPPDSGYSVDNLAPAVPSGLSAAYATGTGNQLSWDDPVDADFEHFRIYRSTVPDFLPAPELLVDATTATGWTDPAHDQPGVYYKVTAVDFSGNESGPASPGTVTSAPGPLAPGQWALHPNVPNPFSPGTTIRYDVPAEGGAVAIRVYDVRGRLVRTLVNGTQAPGQRSVVWDGQDGSGEEVATGVYFYRMVSPGFVGTRRMLLVR